MIDGLLLAEKALSNSKEKSTYSVDVCVLYIYLQTMNAFDCFKTNNSTIHSIKKNCEETYHLQNVRNNSLLIHYNNHITIRSVELSLLSSAFLHI